MDNPATAILLRPRDRLVAADVLRGTCRLLARVGIAPLAEMSLGNGRRADIMGIDAQGRLTIVEIKVSVADLRGDRKWPEYLDYCDRFFWAVPAGFALGLFDMPDLLPARSGLIVADRFDADVLREAPWEMLNPARRRVETVRLARRAAVRVQAMLDPAGGEMADD